MQGYSELVWFNDYFTFPFFGFLSCSCASEACVGGYEVVGLR